MKLRIKQMLFLLLIITSILIILIPKKNSNNEQEDSKEIIPGKSFIQQVTQEQKPYNIKSSDKSTDYYIGESTGRNNTTYSERNGIIEYYLQRDKNKFLHPDIESYRKEFGVSDFIRYNDWFTYGGYSVYVFLKPGIAVTAHPESGVIMEEWHLRPNLNETQFNTNYTTLFKTQPPSSKNQL